MTYTVQEPNAETGEMTNVNKTYDLADLNGSAEGTGWDSVAGASIVYSFDKNDGTAGVLPLCNADGNVILSNSILMGSLKSSSAGAAGHAEPAGSGWSGCPPPQVKRFNDYLFI